LSDNIWLSLCCDDQIGATVVNGSGKSTLVKIVSGMDKEIKGEAKADEGL
jgi:ABC-type polysaccharide/polyol phosphate transport system ATPase subunit